MNYRRQADRIIDRAHNAIANAEMGVIHAYTDEAKALALADLNSAVDWLNLAVAARDAWDRVEHDDYEEYPDVPQHQTFA